MKKLSLAFMRLRLVGAYLTEHWQGFLLAATFGVAVTLISSAWVGGQAWLRALLRVRDGQVLWGIALATWALLIVSSPHAVHFWRRYLRTQTLARPPLQYIDCIVVCIGCAFLACLYLCLPTLTQFWQLGTSKAIRVFLQGLSLLGVLWFALTWAWARIQEAGTIPPTSHNQGVEHELCKIPGWTIKRARTRDLD